MVTITLENEVVIQKDVCNLESYLYIHDAQWGNGPGAGILIFTIKSTKPARLSKIIGMLSKTCLILEIN